MKEINKQIVNNKQKRRIKHGKFRISQQSNFIRNYRTVLQREKDRNKLPTRLREVLEAAGAKMTEIGTTINNKNGLLEDIRGQSND